jgi:hypothetical protein
MALIMAVLFVFRSREWPEYFGIGIFEEFANGEGDE